MGSKASIQAVDYFDCKHFSFGSKHCPQCSRTVCPNCFGFPLFTCPGSFKQACKECFVKANKLTCSEGWEILGEEHNKEVLFLHAEGFSRRMFREHAEELVTKGYRCVLIDLPAHGALINQEFTLKNIFECIDYALSQLCRTSFVSAIGCSLASLALIEYLGAHEGVFKRMILFSCSKGRGMDFFSGGEVKGRKLIHSGRKDLRHTALSKIMEGGLYPVRTKERREFLRRVKPQQSLQRNNGYVPLLFVSGSEEDYSIQQQYLALAGDHSRALVYPSTDEYFWCKEECFYRLLNDITYFMNRE